MEEQIRGINTILPVQRGNVSLTNPQVLKRNPEEQVAEQGCKWRETSKQFWPPVYDLYAHESMGQERRV